MRSRNKNGPLFIRSSNRRICRIFSPPRAPEQSAIAETRVRACLDRLQKPLNFTFDKCRRFAFGPRKSFGLDFPCRIHGEL